MNLHQVRFPMGRVALWLTARGQNGRPIGEHLWPVEEGTPPAFDATNRHTWNAAYWQPARFTFHVFRYANIFRGGYVPPLCGHRSGSRSPHVQQMYGPGTCPGCIAAAAALGYTPLTYNQATDQSPVRRALQQEQAEWERAGRPETWPLTSETTT